MLYKYNKQYNNNLQFKYVNFSVFLNMQNKIYKFVIVNNITAIN